MYLLLVCMQPVSYTHLDVYKRQGLHHLVWEIVDNSIDEALNGFGETIKITIEKDGVICVEDEGRGMPVDMHVSGVPTLQVIHTVLHAGGKFSSQGGYKTCLLYTS